MNGIKRYDPICKYVGCGDYVPEVEQVLDGDFVLFTDHEADKAEAIDAAVAAKDAEIAALKHDIEQAIDHASIGWTKLAESEARCQSIGDVIFAVPKFVAGGYDE